MLVTSIEPVFGKKNKFKVRLDDGADFVLYKRELSRYGICEGEDFPQESYESLLSEVFIKRSRARCLHLLEKQDRTEANLRMKLKESGYPMEAVEDAINYAKGYGYINDERFLRNYISYHAPTKSKRRITLDLINKGVSKELINSVMEALSEEALDSGEVLFDEEEKIRSYVERKLTDPSDEKQRSRIYNHLLREGYSSSDILSAMDCHWRD